MRGSAGVRFVAQNSVYARQAAAILLKIAKQTSDPKMAASLVRVAADLKEQAGELSPDFSLKPPDVQINE
jgi:hypothetical protein